jgi:hypothetical protein
MDARTGGTLPGLTRLSNWLRTHQQHAFLGLGPGRTAVLAESDSDDRVIRSLHVIDLTDGRLLWTTPVRHPLERVAVGVTHRMLYELNGSELTAYSLRSGAAIGHMSLPVIFAGDAPGLNAELVPGRAEDPAELIAGSQHEALLANGLLVARTACAASANSSSWLPQRAASHRRADRQASWSERRRHRSARRGR